ncbi:hypothetical protein JB92DRAFT_3052444 [Gautieria morchelliformis]|nr:hypothetical protein JB92DRAFT_3052444 [Gautieria morchelliformis]
MSNINTNASEKGAYGAERTKQETGAAQKAASTYVDQATGTASDAVASVQETASQAASQTRRATDDFQSQATAQVNAAANEGKKDVEAIRTTGAGYVEQAKALPKDVLSTAQGYVSGSQGNANDSQPGVSSSLQPTANAAVETSKNYLASAQEAIQPHIQSAQETVQPYLESAQATVQPHMDTAVATAKPYVEKAQSTLASTFESGNGDEKNRSS